MASYARAVLLVAWLVLAVLPVAPPAGAQDAPKDAETSDNPGDVVMRVPSAPPQAPPSGQGDVVDITKLTIGKETETELKFIVAFQSVDWDYSVQPRVLFDFQGQMYQLARGGRNCESGFQVQVWDGADERFRGYRCVAAAIDEGAKTLTLTVKKELITNTKRAPIRFGDTIANVSAAAEKRVGFGPGGGFVPTVRYEDRVPDDPKQFGTPYVLQLGRVGAGPVGLYCLEPVRVSNGEATTFVYAVELANKGTQEESFEITAELGEHQGHWTIRMPPILKVGAGQTIKFPVIVSLPFTHEHGATALFKLHAHSTRDPQNAWSTVELGVHWTETPQPAGHHPEVWFHSRIQESWGDDPTGGAVQDATNSRRVWMNPLETDVDEAADDAPVPAAENDWVNERMWWWNFPPSAEPPPETWTTGWILPLSPGLLIGLDFDLERQGKFLGDIIYTRYAIDQTQLDVALLHCDPSRVGGNANCSSAYRGWIQPPLWSVVAKGTSEEKAGSTGEQGVRYVVPLTVEKNAEILPYKKGANVALLLTLKTNLPANLFGNDPAPQLRVKYGTGESAPKPLTLPLVEYHDPIDPAFTGVLGGLSLNPIGDLERKVNPGRTTLFRFEVRNNVASEDNVQLELQGSDNKEWAEVLGDKVFTLPLETTREVRVAVKAPKDASAESRVALGLLVQSLSVATTLAFERFAATVVDDVDIPDEAPSVAIAKRSNTPAFEVVLVLAALAGAVGAGRRRPHP